MDASRLTSIQYVQTYYLLTCNTCYNIAMTITPIHIQKKTDLLALTLPQLQQWLTERGEASFRARQIYSWLYQQLTSDFSLMTDLPQSLRDKLAVQASIGPIVVRNEVQSKDNRPRKSSLESSAVR